MSVNTDLQVLRLEVLHGFEELGFKSVHSFYNVCRSVNSEINGFKLLEFYQHGGVDRDFVNQVVLILEIIKKE